MKNIIILLLFILITPLFILAQSGKNPSAKDKAPTQKEMNELLKEAKKAMNEMDPEQKKMMDSLGIKMPSFKDIPKISNQQLAKAWQNESLLVPKRDAVRIKEIPKNVNAANVKAYITGIQKKSSALLPAGTKAMSEKVQAFITTNSKNAAEAGNMACALWIAGQQELALLVMGHFCTADPLNTDNLNNYASMLSMQGGQHLAIPMLNNLNTKYPQNSTVLNNLGQAWFGLGDLSIAEKYLDSTIRIYAYHPQANLTKAAIEESRGNVTKAREALKRSIKHSYTNEKEDQLRKLGYQLELEGLKLPFKPGSDPLGLGKFARPGYPISTAELKMIKPLWEKFDQECDGRIDQLQNEMSKVAEQFEKNMLAGKMNISIPLHMKKTSLKLDEIQKHYENKLERLVQKFEELVKDLETIKAERKRAAPEAPCEMHIKFADDFFKKYNDRQKEYHDEFLEVQKHYINDMAYYSQFTITDKAAFDILVLEFKIDWLRKIKEYHPLLYLETEGLECLEEEDAEPGKLADFDVVACNYNDTLDLKVWAFYQNCSRMTSKLNLKFIEYTRYDNFERAEGDTYESSTMKISVEKGFDKLKKEYGPLKLEAKVGAAIELEFDRQGIKDVNLSAEAKVGAGHNVLDEGLEKSGSIAGKDMIDNTVEIGVEGRISLVSGKGSIGGTGKLEGIRMLEW